MLVYEIFISSLSKSLIAFEKFIPDAMIHDLDDRLYYFSTEINFKKSLNSVISIKLRLI